MNIITEITPRESSDDTENNKKCANGTNTGAAPMDKTEKNILINDENVQESENRSSVIVTGDEEVGAVGGDGDDSVFMDDAIPSTSKTTNTIAQLPSHRLSIDNTSSEFIIMIHII